MPRVLVAGVGNIFHADDGFGVEVARRLLQRPPSFAAADVRVVDFGIRGVDLAYALLEGYDAVVLVDALQRGGPPGTLYVLAVEAESLRETLPAAPGLQAHEFDPLNVLHWVLRTGGSLPPLRVVGCEPGRLAADDMPDTGLSDPVRAAVEEAVRLVEGLVEEFIRGGWTGDGHA